MQIYDFGISLDLMETTKHGSDEFPLAIYDTVLSKNVLGFIDWHWHNELQFCFVTNGQVQITLDRTVHLLTVGMGIFINARILHMAKPLTPTSSYCCIDVNPALVSSFPGSTVEKKYITPLISDVSRASLVLSSDIPWQSTILEQLKIIYSDYAKKKAGYELSITSHLMYCMWILLFRTVPEDYQQKSRESSRLIGLTSYIHGHYREKLTLASLAEQVNLCPNECCRYFKKHMGCTLFEYINNVRISKSADALLEQPEATISQIAYDYGFSTTSLYIQRFRSATGMTPGEFRKRHKL